MRETRRAIRCLCAVALLASMAVMSATAEVDAAPIYAIYSNDFSGTGSNTDFPSETTTTSGSLTQTWTVTGGVYRHTNTLTSNVPSSASLPITTAAARSFTVETQFLVSSTGTVNAGFADTLGFGLFGLDPAFTGTTASNAYYLADFNYAHGTTATLEGGLRILSLGDSAGFVAGPTGLGDDNAGSNILAVALGTTYTLRLQVVYVGPSVNMTLGLFDASGTTQIGTSATASDTSPLTGTNFGYRNRIPMAGGTASMDFDNYLITPEPSTAFAALGLGAFLLRRRSNQNYRRFVA